MNTPDISFREWVRLHRAIFLEREYDIKSMIEVGHAAGFSAEEVAEGLSDWPRALWGSTSENVAKFYVDCETKCIERLSGRSLADQWYALGEHLMKGRDFGDIR